MWRALWLVVVPLILLVLTASHSAPIKPLGSPALAVVAAAKDVVKVPLGDRRSTRYLSLYAIPSSDRAEFLQVLNFHVNSLSRLPDFARPVLITPDLVRLNIADYDWDPEVFEKLADVDSYFHLRAVVGKGKTFKRYWRGGRSDGRFYKAGFYTETAAVKQEVTLQAPWVDAELITILILLTNSQTPILRADWFLIQTAINKERVAGYYSFLKLKNRADFEKLTGLDVKLAQASFREVATIVRKSGVSIRNRQIFRFGATDAGFWRTLDRLVNGQVKDGNAINQLDKDFVHQAEEHYGFLPNRLFGYYLSDANGGAQDTAPDEVGPDKTSTSNDFKIHVFLSCVRCHVEGLRPINDYARRLFSPPNRLTVVDDGQFRRLKQLYLGEYQRWLDRDVSDFSWALSNLNGAGWTIAHNSRAYGAIWQAWVDEDVTRTVAASESGVSEEALIQALRKFATPLAQKGLGQILPNTLGAFLPNVPLLMTREHWEEHFGLTQFILAGLTVPSNLIPAYGVTYDPSSYVPDDRPVAAPKFAPGDSPLIRLVKLKCALCHGYGRERRGGDLVLLRNGAVPRLDRGSLLALGRVVSRGTMPKLTREAKAAGITALTGAEKKILLAEVTRQKGLK